MLNNKKHNKIALVIMGILSSGIVLCLIGYKPPGTKKKLIESSN